MDQVFQRLLICITNHGDFEKHLIFYFNDSGVEWYLDSIYSFHQLWKIQDIFFFSMDSLWVQ